MRPTALAVLLLAAAVGPLRAEAPSVAGTLPEDFLPELKGILAGAVNRAPSAIAASINLAQSEAGLYGAEAALWPTVGGSASYAASKESVSGGGLGSTSKGVFYSANVSQPIFQWGAFKWQADTGKLSVQIAQRSFAEAYRQLAVTVRSAYLQLIIQRITLRNAEFKLHLAKTSAAVAEETKKAGAISEAQYSEYQMLVQDNQLFADRAREDLRYSRLVFMRLAGLDELPEDRIPLAVPAPVYNAALADAVLHHFFADGIQSTFQYESYQMTIKSDDLSYRIARTRLLPKFSAYGSYSLSNNSTASPGYVTQTALSSISYGVTGNWTIFDGFATKGAKLSALASKRTAERQQQTYLDRTIDSAGNLRNSLDFAYRSRGLAETRAALIKAAVDKTEGDVKLGLASKSSLENVTSAYYVAELAQANARSDYFATWSNFVSLTQVDPALANLPSRYVR
jgi:outer membrane protein TolC